MLKLPCLTYFSNSFLNLFGICLSVHKPSLWLSKHVCVCLFLKLFFFPLLFSFVWKLLHLYKNRINSKVCVTCITNVFRKKLDFLVGFCSRLTLIFSWLLFSSHPPSQYVSKFLVFSFNNTNDYKITARKALLTSMTICYSVQQEAQTLVSYENLWFVYLSLRALGVPRLELCCWKSPHELEDRNIQKLLIADLNICSFKC